MIEIRECDNYEAAKELILEYSKIMEDISLLGENGCSQSRCITK